jgi:NAD(P)-dependent dehydrogenase (short-subunit alcohol dehydrogenase family)
MTAEARFLGRACVVTAAASGIGAAVAEQLEHEGARVWRLDKQSGDGFGRLKCDVTSDADIDCARRAIVAETPVVHHIYNGVGILPPRLGMPLEEEDLQEWRSVFDTNLHSMVRVLAAFAPHMGDDGKCSVVNMSSDQSLAPRGDALAYAASKAAVNAFTVGLARQWVPRQIRVNAVAAGAIRSDFINTVAKSPERCEAMFTYADDVLPYGLGEPALAAKLIVFLLSTDAQFITGEIFRADSGQALIGLDL